jgi:type IV pilus assembly protein PilW
MQENGRYALKTLARDFAMADFWGQVLSTDTVATSLSPSTGDCGNGISVFDATSAVLTNNNHASPAITQFTPCSTISTVHQTGTDVVAIKRVSGAPTAQTFIDITDSDGDGDTAETLTTGASDLVNGEVYLRSNGTTGSLISSASSSNPPALDEKDWMYVPKIYFVRNFYDTAGDGIPSLCRVTLSGTDLDQVDCIAEGVEDFHVEYGLDTDADGTANRYLSTPTAADMDNLVTVRIFLLMRSRTADAHYTNSKTYTLGTVTKAAANDGFYRRVYSTTVSVRNTVGRREFL